MPTRRKLLKRLEEQTVNQNKFSPAELDETERRVLKDSRSSSEGLGIEEEEEAGQEPYSEIEEALKDPDEEEEE